MITAATALIFTIPANTFHWQMEIWKRGGAAWAFDRNGHLSWRWTVKPVSGVHPKKGVIAPSAQGNDRVEQL
jgi:hypothetical protein